VSKEHHLHLETLVNLGSLALLVVALFGNFSLETKHKIKERARQKLGYIGSELSGRCDEPLECAHWDHSRDNPGYDTASNGRLLTISEHLKDHELRAGRNGLNRKQNNQAIAALKSRVRAFRQQQQQESENQYAAVGD
jgi:hypothetical protein